jgi:hypothetical protein
MISASGCRPECSSTCPCRILTCSLSTPSTATIERVVAAYAPVIAVSRPESFAAQGGPNVDVASSGVLECCQVWLPLSFAAQAGYGALPSSVPCLAVRGCRPHRDPRTPPAPRGSTAHTVPQPLGAPGAFPDQCLVCSGNHFHRFGPGLSAATGRS